MNHKKLPELREEEKHYQQEHNVFEKVNEPKQPELSSVEKKIQKQEMSTRRYYADHNWGGYQGL
jgi:hypothetical protein